MKIKSAGYVLALIAAAILSCPGPSWTQYQARLEGVVTDTAGAPLAKVAVTIVSQKAASVHYDLTTDSEGKFSQSGMMPGYYQVSFKKEGFQPQSSEVHVLIADVTRLGATLKKGADIIEKVLSEADELFLRGNNLFEEKKYEEAVSIFQEAIKLNPVNWGYYFNLGLAYKKLDKRDDALASFRKAVELNPESYSSNKELGEALAKADSFEEAAAFYEKAVDLSPENPDAYFNLGACLINIGRTDEALSCFLKTTELKPDYADAYYQIGTIYIGQNKVPEAVAGLEKFLTLAPDHEKAPLAKQLLEYLKK
jgi:tetratricopeptide (TPR) repeat protein